MLENIKKQLESAYEIRDINDIEKDIDEGKKVPEVIMIDSTSKESASIT
mgnify:CR=1 FL=1